LTDLESSNRILGTIAWRAPERSLAGSGGAGPHVASTAQRARLRNPTRSGEDPSFCCHNLLVKYSFDHAKLAANVARHGVWFAEAEGFEWAEAVIVIDSRMRYGESRLVATAPIGRRLHVMVFTLRNADVRIISLRRANLREVKRYAQDR
jgi:uncharacterized DUF497 family protein